MTQILPYSLWIGAAGDLRDWRRLYDLGIRAIVELAYEETPVALPRDFVVCRFPLVDGGGNDAELLRLAVDTLTRLLEEKFATLVCCQAGLSRSPGLTAAALTRLTGEPFAVCLNQVAAYRPCQVHPGLVAQLQGMCGS
jgi:hypothetical protein